MTCTRLAAGLAALLATTAAATAQDKPVALRFAHWVPATHPIHKVAEEDGDGHHVHERRENARNDAGDE